MPWINKDMCTGCQICIGECSAGTISMVESFAVIDEENCIRCGVCHDVCPEDAVRHDGERIPDEVESNMLWIKDLLGHEYYLNDKEKQNGLIDRLMRYFAKNRKVIDMTIERLDHMRNAKD